jgi:phosphatidylglycerol---prolipoprotein diacylglyceryl transferase
MNQEAHGFPVSEHFLNTTIIPDWIMDQMTINGVTYHPTFLYESMWNLVGLIILLLLRRVSLKRGEMFLFYLTWYSFGRYFIEGMRTDSLMGGALRTAQVVSVITIIIAVIFFVIRRYVRKVDETYQDN